MSKTVLILSVADLRHMSMIAMYTEIFDRCQIEYDVICADLYGTIPQYINGQVYAIPMRTSNKNKLQKIPDFLNYRKKAIDIIGEKTYDFTVVWGEKAAVIFSKYLKGKRYCVNIRDFNFPNRMYASILASTAKHAIFNTIPIDTKIDGLNIENTIPIISINNSIIKQSTAKASFRDSSKPIRISYIGKIRFIDTIKTILKHFGNDNRYILQFFGSGADLLKDYVFEDSLTNVVLEGTFNPEDTYKYFDSTDIINACYGDGSHSKISKYALPIRFGYGPSLRIPVLVSQNTYMSKMVTDYGIGYVFQDRNDIADLLYTWYTSENFASYVDGCNSYLRKCNEINARFTDVLLSSM